MNTLVFCSCGHTLKEHHASSGCERCPCALDRMGSLETAIEKERVKAPAIDARETYHIGSLDGTEAPIR